MHNLLVMMIMTITIILFLSLYRTALYRWISRQVRKKYFNCVLFLQSFFLKKNPNIGEKIGSVPKIYIFHRLHHSPYFTIVTFQWTNYLNYSMSTILSFVRWIRTWYLFYLKRIHLLEHVKQQVFVCIWQSQKFNIDVHR